MDEGGTPAATGAQRLVARVRGRVQGVGFRAFVRDRAQAVGLRGAVWNGDDGAVYVVAEGPRAGLDTLVQALGQGPWGAAPSGVDAEWQAATGQEPAPFRVVG